MKRILVVSWFYPPINSSEGLVTYKLLKNSNLLYDVCTQSSVESWSYGLDNGFPEPDHVRRISLSCSDLESWKDEVVKYFAAHADEYDILMTRSMPPTSHEVGLKIKELKPSIRWIASFGDPIADNPFVLKCFTRTSPFSLKARYETHMSLKQMLSPMRVLRNLLWKRRYAREIKPLKRDRVFQRKVLENCDCVLCNSEQQKEYMLSAYGEQMLQKALVLPHSFDKSLYPPKEESGVSDHTKKRVVYIGSLDDIRTPHSFLVACKELKEQMQDLPEKLEVFFYGSLSDQEKVYILNEELFDFIKIKKPVSYRESLKIMQDADLNLLIDANLHPILDHNIFFAAKLADYMGAGKPICGITMGEGPSAEILSKLCVPALSYSPEEIKNFLYLFVYENKVCSPDPSALAEYDAVKVAKDFDGFVTERL